MGAARCPLVALLEQHARMERGQIYDLLTLPARNMQQRPAPRWTAVDAARFPNDRDCVGSELGGKRLEQSRNPYGREIGEGVRYRIRQNDPVAVA
jgi:hypothetical protein